MERETRIEGVVEHVVYANEETGWTVARLGVRARGTITVVGSLVGVQPGETLKLEGAWIRDPRYGKQFRVESFETVRPSTFVGIERYLSSGLVEGIGPTMARRLVQHFGLDTLDVIDDSPERLVEVEGIGKVRSQRIRDAWKAQRHVRDIMVFLQGHGISAAFAAKIQETYGDQSLDIVTKTPHRLARDVRGIGFLTADRIAREVGVAPEAPERLDAGVLHVLREEVDRGHVFVEHTALLTRVADLLEVERLLVEPAIDRLVEQGDLSAVEIPTGGTAVSLRPLERAEAGLARRLRELTAQKDLLPTPIDVPKAVAWYEKRRGIRLAPKQREALGRALLAKVLVLTGGPGTGKTTLIRGVVEILRAKKVRIQMAAPTGRAAKRMQESTGIDARTIHRLLEFQPETRDFARGPSSPLSLDLLIVDEASMLDTFLAHRLVQALPDGARLLLVGDVDQLPSIGPGRVLADLIESGEVEVARLTEIFRQGEASQIVTNAHRVRDGLMPIAGPVSSGQSPGPSSDFFFIERREPEAILDTLRYLVAERIPESFGLQAMEDIQVLTPMQRGLLGAANLNAELQALLNPPLSDDEEPLRSEATLFEKRVEEVRRGGHLLRVGDRVMQRRNDYDLGVFNGDVGRVVGLDLQEQRASVDVDGRIVLYPFSTLDALSLAYAVSIHKSQGSEYPCVVIPLHTQHYALLQRNLLYTAITRGRRLVVIVGSRRALDVATHQVGSSRRNTLLAERLRGEIE